MRQKLTIYASPIPATYIAGPAIAEFIKRRSDCEVQLITNDHLKFFGSSHTTSFDIGIFDISSFKNSSHLDCEFLLSSSARMCCRTGHPLLDKAGVVSKDILDYPLATPAVIPDYVVHELNRILDLPIIDGHCQVNLIYDSLVTVRHALIHSDMIALAPSLALTQSLSNELAPIKIDDWPLIEAEFGVVTRREISRPPHIELFFELLFEVANRLKLMG